MIRWHEIGAVLSPAVIASALALTPPALAGILHNDWVYAIDSFSDGTEGATVGATSAFEFYALAFKQTGDRLIFAINSNLPLDGYPSESARNGAVSYSDLFLNFTSTDFASANGSLFALRFDPKNDTSVGVGVYSNVTATSLSPENTGYSRLSDYNNQVAASGGTMGYGDATATYFNAEQPAFTTIATGTYLGDVSSVSNLAELGLDFGAVGAVGSQTFGFSVAKAIFPTEDFIAHVFAECGNDGMVLMATIAPPSLPDVPPPTEEVPEPTSLIAIGLIGLAIGSRHCCRGLG